MERLDAIVIGGGVSGMTAAWRVREERPGAQVLVLEENPYVGGNINTYRDGEYLLERGPHSFIASADNVWRLVEDMGIEAEVQTAAAAADNRFVYRDGRIHAIPLSPMSFIRTPLLSFSAKLRLMTEPFRRNGAKENDTALDFFLRRFGREATTYLAGTFVSGIYAGDPAQIGARASFPKFWNFEKECGSMILGAIRYMRQKRKLIAARPARKGLFSFREGLGFMPAETARRLPEGSVKTNAGARTVRSDGGEWVVETASETFRSRVIILATPPHIASKIIGATDADAARILDTIPMAPVALVHLGGKVDASLPVGFGVLVPRHYGIRTLGTVFVSQLFPNRAPDGRYVHTSFIGGTLDPGAVNLSDDELVRIAVEDQDRLMGVRGIDYHNILRYTHAIPQLLPDHPERIARLRERVLTHKGLVLAGNYLTGVGVDHAVGSGYAAAKEAGAFLSLNR